MENLFCSRCQSSFHTNLWIGKSQVFSDSECYCLDSYLMRTALWEFPLLVQFLKLTWTQLIGRGVIIRVRRREKKYCLQHSQEEKGHNQQLKTRFMDGKRLRRKGNSRRKKKKKIETKSKLNRENLTCNDGRKETERWVSTKTQCL